ncbi:Cna B-type domain-containing protein [Allobaculum sp. Allo2]|uniref:Cna B-type domain-containing protein n=1 Tax=Allobaculum sp. Allo2 TaxID=2853432 RepID=UPI001F602D31|nr:Cna B-type domain-containing protein [Allobaculum sp. Allo2]UNT92687.1 Cna B-type domain-containing protein [Allobaculum sp. Allo2]
MEGNETAEVNIELLRDGVLQFNTLTLNDKNGWKGTFENLDAVYENGNAYVYTVQEAGEEPKEKADHPQVLLEGVLYEVEIAGDAQNGFVVTNAETLHTPNNDIEDSEDSSHSSSQSSEDSKRTRPTASPLQKISPAHRLLLPNRLRKAAIPASVIQNRVRTLRKTAFTPV